MANPTIEQLHNDRDFELLAELDHRQIKEFVIDRIAEGGKMITGFMIYQFLMILTGIFFLTRSVVLAFQDYAEPLLYTIGALVFSLSVLVVIHELLHGLAIKLTGAERVTYGAYLRKFIFYAEADRHVLNRQQFAFVALTPLTVVQAVTLAGIFLFFNHPAVYSIIFVMSAHSLFCAGDIGLLSVFYQFGDSEIYTYDVKAEKKSYYFRKRHQSVQ